MGSEALTFGRWLCRVSLFAAAAAVALVVAFSIGYSPDIAGSLKAILGGAWSDSLDLRLSRVLLGFLAGAALAVSGAVLQAALRNPLAEPYLLGISSGAVLGLTVVTLLGAASFAARSSAALAGALLASAAVAALARRVSFTPVPLVLIGVAVNAALSALVLFVVALLDMPRLQQTVYFLMGTLKRYPESMWIACLGVCAAGAAVWAALSANRLNALVLGDEMAAAAGVSPDRLRMAAFAAASAATALSVSLVGLVGFVGLVVPHIVRLLIGGDHRTLVPACFFAGGAFLALADAASRLMERAHVGLQVPVGVVTALAGAPLLVVLVLRRWRFVLRGG